MTNEHKNKWKCPLCLSKMAKMNNTNMPVRQIHDKEENVNIESRKRRQAISPVHDEDSFNLIEGDTLLDDSNQTPNVVMNTSPILNQNEPVTLEQINMIIQQNLQENNKSFLLAIQNTIQKEIERSLIDLKTFLKRILRTSK